MQMVHLGRVTCVHLPSVSDLAKFDVLQLCRLANLGNGQVQNLPVLLTTCYPEGEEFQMRGVRDPAGLKADQDRCVPLSAFGLQKHHY